MAERARRSRRRTLPRANPKTVCPKCGGVLTVRKTDVGEHYVIRTVRCEDCHLPEYESDSLQKDNVRPEGGQCCPVRR